jgi:hypothetical protein
MYGDIREVVSVRKALLRSGLVTIPDELNRLLNFNAIKVNYKTVTDGDHKCRVEDLITIGGTFHIHNSMIVTPHILNPNKYC